MKKQALVAAVALSWFVAAGLAANAGAEEIGYQLPPVVVLGDYWSGLPPAYAGGQVAVGGQVGILGHQRYMDTPFSTTAYTAENIQNKLAGTLQDLLRDDPTVRFQYSPGGLIENLYIRNYAFNANNMTMNGLMGMAPSFVSATELLERVEVQRGPTAFTTGMNFGGEIGGGVNLVTKYAPERDLSRLTLDYASDLSFGGHLDLGRRFGPDDRLGLRFNGAWRGGETTMDDQSNKRRLAAAAFDYTIDNLRLTVDGYHIRDEFDGAGPFIVNIANLDHIPTPPRYADGLRSLHGAVDNTGVQARLELDFNEHLGAYAGFGRARGEMSGFVGGGDIAPAMSGAATLTVANDSNRLDKTSMEAGLRGRFTTGPARHTLTLGFSMFDLDNYRNLAQVRLSGLNLHDLAFDPAALPAAPGPQYLLQNLRLTSFALVDNMTLWNDAVRLVVGARRQNVNRQTYGTPLSAQAQYDQSALTPMVGLTLKPWGESVAIYANYVEGLTTGGTAPATALNRGEIFPPYKSPQAEAGLKWDAGAFTHTLSFYQLKKPAYILTPTAAGNLYELAGEQRNRGLEWLVFGEPRPGLRALGGAVLGEAEMVRTQGGVNQGKEAPGAPRWQGNLGLEWDTIWDRDLTLSLRGVYTGSMYADAANTKSLPAVTTLDAGLRLLVDVGDTPVNLRAAVENVFGRDYWAGMRAANVLTLGPGRIFKFSASVDF